MSGKWIVVTGLDGTGKTTLKNRLIGFLKGRKKLVKDFKAPYDKYLLGLLDVSGDGLPWKDNYTDQLIFTLDNRILSNYVRNWRKEFDYLVSQRGFLDSYVHGEVRGYDYSQVDELLKTEELQKCDVMIHLNADPKVAFDRIKDDPDGDKFETLEYIEKQAIATKRAYEELVNKNPNLNAFFGTQNIYVDTTYITCEQTYKIVLKELFERGIIA